MKVRFLTGIAGIKFIYAPGDEVEMNASEAERWIKSGAAEFVLTTVETATMDKPETAVAPAQFKKKRRY
jgi:hypothetical protein